MTEIDVAKLRTLAENAAPGQWESSAAAAGNFTAWVGLASLADDIALNVRTQEDAEYIATANPATVLALLDRLEQAEAAIERATSKHRKMTDDDEPYCLTCYQSPYGHAPWPCPTVAALDTGKEKNDE